MTAQPNAQPDPVLSGGFCGSLPAFLSTRIADSSSSRNCRPDGVTFVVRNLREARKAGGCLPYRLLCFDVLTRAMAVSFLARLPRLCFVTAGAVSLEGNQKFSSNRLGILAKVPPQPICFTETRFAGGGNLSQVDLILLFGGGFLILVQMLIGAFFVYYGKQGVTKRKIKVGYKRSWWEVRGEKAVTAGWIYIVIGAGFLFFTAYRIAAVMMVLVG